MIAIVGLGVTGDLTERGVELLEQADEVFIETYTSFVPDAVVERLKRRYGAVEVGREEVESLSVFKPGRSVVLLVGGDPLTATTHVALVRALEERGEQVEVVGNSSVFTAVARTGLSLYKFGKVVTLSFWYPNYKPVSPIKLFADNVSVGAHTLFLLDIGMTIPHALSLLEKMSEITGIDLSGCVVFGCQRLCWQDERIIRTTWEERQVLHELEKLPACLVLTKHMSAVEDEFSQSFKVGFKRD
jgi:diphthine synthase